METTHGLDPIPPDRFLMNGKAVCLMSLAMFTARVPVGGKLLFRDFKTRLGRAVSAEARAKAKMAAKMATTERRRRAEKENSPEVTRETGRYGNGEGATRLVNGDATHAHDSRGPRPSGGEVRDRATLVRFAASSLRPSHSDSYLSSRVHYQDGCHEDHYPCGYHGNKDKFQNGDEELVSSTSPDGHRVKITVSRSYDVSPRARERENSPRARHLREDDVDDVAVTSSTSRASPERADSPILDVTTVDEEEATPLGAPSSGGNPAVTCVA